MVARRLGFWATALILYKVATPLRYLATIAASHCVVHTLRARGLAPPLAEEDRLRNLARQGVHLSRTRLRQSSDRMRSRLKLATNKRRATKPPA